jgi:hypothetical protein
MHFAFIAEDAVEPVPDPGHDVLEKECNAQYPCNDGLYQVTAAPRIYIQHELLH